MINKKIIKLPNLECKKGTNKAHYYYRYVVIENNKRKRIRIPLGSPNEVTNTIIRERYFRAQNVAYNHQNGITPVHTQTTESKGQQPVLLVDVFQDWVSHENQGRKASWIKHLHNMKHFVIHFGQESDWNVQKKTVNKGCKIDLAKLTTKDINSFYASQYKLHSNETVHKRNNYLQPLYQWLEAEKLLLDNYYSRKAKLRSPDETKIPFQVLTRKQAELIVDNAPCRFTKILWTIMLDTALAPIDARKLTKKNDFYKVVSDDGSVIDTIVTQRQKSKQLSAIAISERIKALGNSIWELGGTKTIQDDANESFKKVCRKLKIKQNKGERLSQYSFRHSLATHLISEGHSLDSVQRQLGHALGSKVTKTYIANQIASEITKTQTSINKKRTA